MKVKNFCSAKDNLSRELEDKPHTGRKYLQNRHLIKDCNPKYKNLLKLSDKNMNNPIKNGPKTQTPH